MNFEWDEEKRQSNIRKHGIDFVDVVRIFDHALLTVEDTRFEYDEPRYWAFGMLNSSAILIVFIYRDQSIIRIISARKATKHEQKQLFS